MTKKNSVLYLFPEEMRQILEKELMENGVEEIRLRTDKPIVIKKAGYEAFLTGEGSLTRDRKNAYTLSRESLKEILNRVCEDSLYAYEDEVKHGYISVPGGHRVGLAGQVVVNGEGKVHTMKYINSMNIRISHEIKGAGNMLLPFLYRQGRVLNTLIISPPGAGKTTLLRDIIRQISEGNRYGEGVAVSVVDERSEIAGCYQGIPQNDVGPCTDVLDACPKAYGMMMLLRSMAPKVIAIDEIGGMEDVGAIKKVSACGVTLLATIHGEDVWDLRKKAYLQEVFLEELFERYVVLENKKTGPKLVAVYGRNLELCYDCRGHV